MADDFESLEEDAPEEITGKVQFGHGGRYKLPHPITGKIELFTRVSTIAHTIPDTFHLDNWEKRAVVRGMTLWPDLAKAAKGLDISKDSKRLQALATAAKEVGVDASLKASHGSALHALAEVVDSGSVNDITLPIISGIITEIVQDYHRDMLDKGLNIYPLFADQLAARLDRYLRTKLTIANVYADLSAYVMELDRKHINFLPELTERVVINLQYGIVGRIDRVGLAPGWPQPRICDIKTGSIEYDHTAFLMQTALYANADYAWNEKTAKWEPMPEIDKTKAHIIHLPAGQKSCELHTVPIDEGWTYDRLAMNVRNARKRGKVALYPYVDDYQWRTRIEAATSVSELSEIWHDAMVAGEWTESLEKLGMEKRNEIEESNV